MNVHLRVTYLVKKSQKVRKGVASQRAHAAKSSYSVTAHHSEGFKASLQRGHSPADSLCSTIKGVQLQQFERSILSHSRS